MPFQPPDYEMHRARIEQRRANKIKARKTKKKQIENRKRAVLKRQSTRALKGELIRRAIAKVDPELRKEWAARAAAMRALKPQFCDHSKLPPKLRASGKNAGKYVCPSCNTPVPAPPPEKEDLVV